MFDYDPYAMLDPVPSFRLTSADLADGDALAREFYDVPSGGDDLSPQLRWEGFPDETKSFALSCLDPDAPTGSGFWHWAVFNLPVTTTSLERGAGSPGSPLLPDGAVTLPNEARLPRYIGAAPPEGTGVHRYVFVVHAVDVPNLDIDPQSTPAVLGFTLHFHTLARAILTGTGEYAPSR